MTVHEFKRRGGNKPEPIEVPPDDVVQPELKLDNQPLEGLPQDELDMIEHHLNIASRNITIWDGQPNWSKEGVPEALAGAWLNVLFAGVLLAISWIAQMPRVYRLKRSRLKMEDRELTIRNRELDLRERELVIKEADLTARESERQQ